MRKTDDVRLIQKFLRRKVRNEARNFSAFYGIKHICIVYKTAARYVQNANSVLHHFKGRCVYHSFCIVCLRNVKRNVVSVFVNSFKRFGMLYVMVKRPRRIYRKERIVADYVHSELDCRICNHCTDCTKSDDAESFSFKFRTYKL